MCSHSNTYLTPSEIKKGAFKVQDGDMIRNKEKKNHLEAQSGFTKDNKNI